jgi:hypothetical protein
MPNGQRSVALRLCAKRSNSKIRISLYTTLYWFCHPIFSHVYAVTSSGSDEWIPALVDYMFRSGQFHIYNRPKLAQVAVLARCPASHRMGPVRSRAFKMWARLGLQMSLSSSDVPNGRSLWPKLNTDIAPYCKKSKLWILSSAQGGHLSVERAA